MLSGPGSGKHGLLKMGEITQSTGVSDQAVRYYERKGLIRASGRTSGGFRLFTPATISRIHLIKEAQELGFSLEEIRVLLDPIQDGTTACHEAHRLLLQKSRDLDARLQNIHRFAAVVSSLACACDACSGTCSLEADLLALMAGIGPVPPSGKLDSVQEKTEKSPGQVVRETAMAGNHAESLSLALAGVAHDLGSFLHPILNLSESLEQDSSLAPEQRKAVRAMRSAAIRSSALAERLSQIGHQLPPTLGCSLQEPALYLVKSARDATAEGGRITIPTCLQDEDPPCACLEARDEGHGI